MQGKTVVVTGATSGIGQAAALELARLGADVVLLGRSADKAAATTDMIEAKVGRSCVRSFLADFQRLEDVRRVAQELFELPQIDVLLNNAGLVLRQRELTVDGYEKTFAVNHLAPFLLTCLLLPKLLERPGARIVNTSSGAHSSGRLVLEDLQSEQSYAMMKAYGGSKLANLMFTTELTRRLEGRDIDCWSVHPGQVSTDIGTNVGWLVRVGHVVLKPFLKTAAQGARTSIYLCSADIDAPNGSYFVDCKVEEPLARAVDPLETQALWAASLALVGLDDLVL
ncbi:MAG: NAD(P)-dependent dehydrogenase (short-subunit alcohol dehydrogenase family) [Cognaticolwellia sp.]|jgi:NAD(P)-dependent dehydrogenase (short-subunit alcohol dehydrogenase family)